MDLLLILALTAQAVHAQGAFLPADDVRLREDLSLLVDGQLVNLPLNAWPMARVDVAEAIARIDVTGITAPALLAALARVRKASTLPAGLKDWRLREVAVAAGHAGLLRDQATLARDNGGITMSGGMTTDRISISLSATGSVDAGDGQSLRLDGSVLATRWGNWLLSVNQMDRWWGPGQAGGLILSSNARPMPAISLDRVRSLPVDLPLLRWLGPWHFSTFIGIGERRQDVDHPLFMGMRLSFKPSPAVEMGLVRTAQFCGDQRRCTLETVGRMLIGQDNVYMRGLDDPADEPGNQMGGLDVRLVSPFKSLPVAVFGSLVGEDFSDARVPIRYLTHAGAQAWWQPGRSAVLRAQVEYADTSTSLYKVYRQEDPNGRYLDYAYRHHVFFSGYRYRGRNIGHTTDADSETTAISLSLTLVDGQRWAVQWRGGRLDRYGAPDAFNAITQGRSRYRSLQMSWELRRRGQDIGVQVGHQRQSPENAGNANGVYGFVRWRRWLE